MSPTKAPSKERTPQNSKCSGTEPGLAAAPTKSQLSTSPSKPSTSFGRSTARPSNIFRPIGLGAPNMNMFRKPQPYPPVPESASGAHFHAGNRAPSPLEHIQPGQGEDPDNQEYLGQGRGPPNDDPGDNNGNDPDDNAAPRGGGGPPNDPDNGNGGGGGGGGPPNNPNDDPDNGPPDGPPNPINPPDPNGAQFLIALQAISNNLANLHQQVAPPKLEKFKVREPDTFDGSDPRKLRDFLVSCNLHFRDRPHVFADDERKILFILSFLKGAAISWFEPALMDPNNAAHWMWDFKAFITELESNFSPHDPIGDAENLLTNLTMSKNSRILKYNVEFWKLAARLDWNEAALVA